MNATAMRRAVAAPLEPDRLPIEAPRTTAGAARSRIMHVVGTMTFGGTERLVVELCHRLRGAFEPTVCCLDAEGPWADELQSEGIEVIALRRADGFRPELGRRIARIARERSIPLLHCHQYSPFVYGRIAKYWTPSLALVYTEHGRRSDAPPAWKRRVANSILGRVDGAIVAVSGELRRYMIAARFPAARMEVIHNGITLGAAPSPDTRAAARRMLGLDDRDFVVMTVGRLDPVKDFGTLLDAGAILRREIPRVRLVVIGEGPEREHLLERGRRPDVDGIVTFAGYRANVRELLAAADVYASSSLTEGISLTILEAMASEVPVVATAVGGTPEIITDGVTGLLVPRLDPAAMARRISILAVDPAVRAALGQAGRAHVQAAFAIERMVDEYAQMYRRLVR